MIELNEYVVADVFLVKESVSSVNLLNLVVYSVFGLCCSSEHIWVSLISQMRDSVCCSVISRDGENS